MDKLHLAIVMPTGKVFEGDIDRVMVRTTQGEVSILPRHIDYAAALGEGQARVTINGSVQKAMLRGGMMHVANNQVRILTSDFEWQN